MYWLSQLYRTVRVVAFNVSILLRVTRLNKLKPDTVFVCPLRQIMTDELRAVVAAQAPGFSSPLNDLMQRTNNPYRGQRKACLNTQPFPVKIIQHIKQAKRPAIAQLVMHKIH